jgi:hypothetical protein
VQSHFFLYGWKFDCGSVRWWGLSVPWGPTIFWVNLHYNFKVVMYCTLLWHLIPGFGGPDQISHRISGKNSKSINQNNEKKAKIKELLPVDTQQLSSKLVCYSDITQPYFNAQSLCRNSYIGIDCSMTEVTVGVTCMSIATSLVRFFHGANSFQHLFERTESAFVCTFFPNEWVNTFNISNPEI